MPVVLEYLFCLYVLGVYHESTCVAVEAVYNVCAAFLARLQEVVVEHRLHIERRMACCHRQNADILLYNDEPSVFVYNLNVATLELVLLLVTADDNLVACFKLVVELSYHSSVHGNATTLQRCFQLGAALAYVIDEIFEQGSVLLDGDNQIVASLCLVCIVCIAHLF